MGSTIHKLGEKYKENPNLSITSFVQLHNYINAKNKQMHGDDEDKICQNPKTFSKCFRKKYFWCFCLGK